MAVRLGAVVLTTARVPETLRFYRSLGLPLAEEDHGDGVGHWACEADGVHVAVFPTEEPGDAPGYHHPGSTFCGFVVDDVDRVVAELRAAGATVVQEPTSMPWGLRAVVLDPDGRPVEVFHPSPDPAPGAT